MAVVEPETAFWSLVRKGSLADALSAGSELLNEYNKKAASFTQEMDLLRDGLKPSAVYFNPTEMCNLDCPYCYIPQDMRRDGKHMSEEDLIRALGLYKEYFDKTLPEGVQPQIIFHGAEPLLNRDAVFAGIEKFASDFRFGVQSNGTLLDGSAIDFLTGRNVSIGISIDASSEIIAKKTRRNWDGQGVQKKVVEAMERLRGYEGWSVICTVTSENMAHLSELVEFLHCNEVPTSLLNIVRCTLPSSLEVKPDDAQASKHFIKALDMSYDLFVATGRKLPIANFANILLSILAPTARRLMCDISPCGGGRCFFAMAPNGDLFPCSEFIGLKEFKGGNLFKGGVEGAMASSQFGRVTGRRVEDITPCRTCAIRHYCGAPCPAEACERNGSMESVGAFCEFYEEQVRYAFRLIADNKQEAFLWDGWDSETKSTFYMNCF